MLRPLRLLNLLLGVAAVLTAAALIRMWVVPIVSPASGPAVTKPSREAEALAYSPITRPPLTQFEVLLEKNPFKQPPPMPAQPSAVAPPPPLPTLVGTVLVDDERRAILSLKGKSQIYTVGQEVAGGIVARIDEDRIVLKRGTSDAEILLKAIIEAAPAPQGQTPAPADPSAVAPSPITPPVAVRPPAAGREGRPDQSERQARRQAKEEMRRQQKALRDQLKNR